MSRPHLRDVPIPDLESHLERIGVSSPATLARRLALDLHKRGALDRDDLQNVGRDHRRHLADHFRLGAQLVPAGVREAEDGTTKLMFRIDTGPLIETVLIRNRGNHTLCISSQAGCALGCTFCATGLIGLQRNLSAGEITESLLRTEQRAGVRVTDVVFMGQGEPLHNYDAVMDACTNLNHDFGHCISRKRITVSTSGLTPQIRRFTRERRPWRLHLSLHSAVPETRRELMPIARMHPLDGLIEALVDDQRVRGVAWTTLQYVLIPGVNMDQRHVDALGERLGDLRYILNVIPWNDTGGPYRAPTWSEVKEFTNRLRALNCPVKVRYSAGKQEGMGCGQLSAEAVAASPRSGHMLAPPGIFSDLAPAPGEAGSS